MTQRMMTHGIFESILGDYPLPARPTPFYVLTTDHPSSSCGHAVLVNTETGKAFGASDGMDVYSVCAAEYVANRPTTYGRDAAKAFVSDLPPSFLREYLTRELNDERPL